MEPIYDEPEAEQITHDSQTRDMGTVMSEEYLNAKEVSIIPKLL